MNPCSKCGALNSLRAQSPAFRRGVKPVLLRTVGGAPLQIVKQYIASQQCR